MGSDRLLKKNSQIPVISTAQMVEVDRLMIEVYGISLIQMMENAGRNLAELSRRLLGGTVNGRRIAVMCGAGNNGGGGMVAARHLHNWGARISLKTTGSVEKMKDIPARQLRILREIGILDAERIELNACDLILDAMIGYGLTGSPRGTAAEWIQRVNHAGRPVLALDTPSGLDTTSGIPGRPCIKASATMTLALPKTGLVSQQAGGVVGDLYLADISVPNELYARMGLDVPKIFDTGLIIRL
jgi:NAD(P)H-hydrate epimerase